MKSTFVWLALLAFLQWPWRSPIAATAHPEFWGRLPLARRRASPLEGKKKWSAMFTVDPSAILSSLLKAGGIFIPDSSRKDIDILRECLHCQHAEMNLVERTLILYNLTVGLQGEPAAMQVGRTYVYWDSYSKPTLFVEVDDVFLTVEFYNVLLTKSNWQMLKRRGFPPDILVSSSEGHQSSETVRLGSIDLSGTARVHLVSKPLQRDLGLMELDMDSFDDFTSQMQAATERNFKESGRRGITSTEMTTMLQSYFMKKIRAYLRDAIENISGDTTQAVADAKGLAHEAFGSLRSYVSDATRKKGQDLKEAAAARVGMSPEALAEIGDSLRRLDQLSSATRRREDKDTP